MSNELLIATRLDYTDPIGNTLDGDPVVFNDEMNKFLDLLLGIGNTWSEVGASGAPSFENSWTNFDGTRHAEYRKIGNQVFLRGVISSGSPVNSVSFTLPKGYKPSSIQIIAGVSQLGSSTIVVDVNGEVTFFAGGSATWSSLNCSFFID